MILLPGSQMMDESDQGETKWITLNINNHTHW